jgi:rhamnosyltransferase
VAYSNVNSAARRSVWRTTPFDESVTIAEDRLWARSVTGAGLRVVYEPAASVWHSHRYSLREVYRRCREEAASRRTVEGRTETVGLLLKAWPRQTARDARRLAAEGTLLTWPHAAAYRFAQFAGMMAGGRP